MKLGGSVAVAAPPRAVWELLVDPLVLAGCVPGARDVHQVDERTFAGSIVVSVGPIDGDFAFTSVIGGATFPDLEVELEGVDSVTRSRLFAIVRVALSDRARRR
jgi:uncharacterized protein